MANMANQNFIFQNAAGTIYSISLDLSAGTGTARNGPGFTGSIAGTLQMAADIDKLDSYFCSAAIFGAGDDTSLEATIAAF